MTIFLCQRKISNIKTQSSGKIPREIYATFFLPKAPSRKSPAKTSATPNHCRGISELPKKTTEASTVKNLRVVVTMEQGSGPNSLKIADL